jgi:hypothetical protein
MPDLHEAIAAKVVEWRDTGYAHELFPAAGEILQHALDGEEPGAPFPQSGNLRFLRTAD